MRLVLVLPVLMPCPAVMPVKAPPLALLVKMAFLTITATVLPVIRTPPVVRLVRIIVLG